MTISIKNREVVDGSTIILGTRDEPAKTSTYDASLGFRTLLVTRIKQSRPRIVTKKYLAQECYLGGGGREHTLSPTAQTKGRGS